MDEELAESRSSSDSDSTASSRPLSSSISGSDGGGSDTSSSSSGSERSVSAAPKSCEPIPLRPSRADAKPNRVPVVVVEPLLI